MYVVMSTTYLVRGLGAGADDGVTVLGQRLQLRQHVQRASIVVVGQTRQKPLGVDALAVQGMNLSGGQPRGQRHVLGVHGGKNGGRGTQLLSFSL